VQTLLREGFYFVLKEYISIMEQIEFEKRSERFFKHLPETDDLTLLVLKGHLLIEEQLNDALAKCCESPESLENYG